jgi:hypothetical protein
VQREVPELVVPELIQGKKMESRILQRNPQLADLLLQGQEQDWQ